MGYYEDLSFEEEQAILSVMASLKLNRDRGQAVTRQDINKAFAQATGKVLSLYHMRDPAVIQLMSMISPVHKETGAFSRSRTPGSVPSDPSIAITDKNLAARGLPVPRAPAPTPIGATRYSSSAAPGSRFGR